MQLGIDRLVQDTTLRAPLRGKRVGLVAHPASVTADLRHSLDALAMTSDVQVVCAFGPQHGMRGEKQDNMVESDDYRDPIYGIPVYSLYGKTRRPTPDMLDTIDVVVVDLQDVGCRIYTFITTLLYMLEACAGTGKAVWVLDRPNPAGRSVEGMILESGWESFVGSAQLPMRYGLTIGELAQWFVQCFGLDVELHVITMQGYDSHRAPGYGWPVGELSWVNPSPNAGSLSMARVFSGTVLVEGTTLSEGRGTTRALEVVGAPDLDMSELLTTMHRLKADWLRGCQLRVCHFEPTFHKHTGQCCHGLQFHVDHQAYNPETFMPYRAVALLFKAIRMWSPGYDLWRQFVYEYEPNRLAIDVINGGPRLREWVDDPQADVGDLESILLSAERQWRETRKAFERYPINA
jgi:uncharacterized protein YbbC (DUF1343 family)